jgi:xylono-1,5-lactonase
VAEVRLTWDIQAQLGEGALWNPGDDAFWFTDIKRRKIYRFDPANGDRREWDSPEQVGFVVPAQSGGFIAGLQSGLHRFDPATGAFAMLAAVEPKRPGNRLNDAVVDRQGRLWFGTMDDGEREPTGAFHCFHRGELRETGIRGIAITNGPAVSPDGSTLYWVDTRRGIVSSAPIQPDGSLGESLELVRIDPSEGHPDGPSIDSMGNIWIALYGGWQARLYSPSGELLERVHFPVANITKVALGGPALTTAIATTARQKLDSTELETQPLAGGLFDFEVETPGIGSFAVADER